MQNTIRSLPRLILTILLLSVFSPAAYADTADAIDRQQQAQPAAAPTQSANAAQSGVTAAAPAIIAREPVKDDYSVGQFLLGFVGWAFALFVMVYIYGRLVGALNSKAGNTLLTISIVLSCAGTALVILNKFPTQPMNALSGLLGWWLAQCVFIYLCQRMGKSKK